MGTTLTEEDEMEQVQVDVYETEADWDAGNAYIYYMHYLRLPEFFASIDLHHPKYYNISINECVEE